MDYADVLEPATQPDSQSQDIWNIPVNSWASLWPINPGVLTPLVFREDMFSVHIGRSAAHGLNTFTLPGPKVSNHHCIFEWNGQKGERCTILLRDLSSNGTYVNGHCIGTGQAMLVRDGNLICFGSAYENRHDRALDYRYSLSVPNSAPPREGFYKDYDMAGQLGSGAFATVFQAVDRSTGNFVAVKVIKTRNLSSAGTNSMDSMMHIREIEIMQKLHHEYIVDMKNVYNHEEEGKVYIVMELVEGGDLLAFALDQGPLPEHLARHFMYQICRALEYCHAKGITHRDLKPENILLTKDSPPTVKIADFGLGKMVDSLTHLKTMCGTPAYLAPEVLAQTPEGYSNAVDSWSVGVILFSILTLNTPFQEENESLPLSVRIRQRRVEWSLLDQPDFHISNACKNLIQRLLRTDPTERLTLTAALAHPWLAECDSEMTTLASNPEGDDDLGPLPQAMAIEVNQGSSRQLVRRRSDVLAEVNAGIRRLPEPTIEMVQHMDVERQRDRQRERRRAAEVDNYVADPPPPPRRTGRNTGNRR